ncbi:MAG: DNA polymerase III subunit delta [Clostridia bacterium]|nr:DNA polymerase III subunit delta [Clostridia bacterium]
MLQNELKTQLKAGKIGGVYLFSGEEDYLKRYYLGEIRKAILTDPVFDAFNHPVFHGEEIDFAALTDAIQAPPMMADRKLIEWTGADLEDWKDADFAALEGLVRTVNENPAAVVVFLVGQEGMAAGTLKRPSALFKRLSGIVQTVNFETSTDDRLAAWLNAHIVHEGLDAEPGALRAMIDRCGHSMDILSTETGKLVCYARAHELRTVTVAMVELVCASTAEDDAFGLTNAVLEGDTPGAYRKLSDLVRRRVDPMVVLGQVSRLISDLASVACLLEEGTPPSGVASVLGMNEYKAKLYIGCVGKRRPEQFRELLAQCREMDLASKRGADPLIQIERFLSTASDGVRPLS